jgi:hypothetical protein
VLLAVESQRGRRLSVLAEPSVLNTLLTHRLHELQSTGTVLGLFLQAPMPHAYPADCGDASLLPYVEPQPSLSHVQRMRPPVECTQHSSGMGMAYASNT